jgi:serine/threonine-protein kinase
MAEPATPQGAEPESAILGPIADRYDLGDRIARGGMGIVYRAHDRHLNRTVAVKVMRSRFMDRPDLLRRFLAEARISGRLQHPGIVPIYDFGTLDDARPYIAMKLIEGQTLAKLLRDRPNPADNRSHFLKVFEAICQAVGYAHRQGVIHRDLKPDNMMVGEFGEVQVMDWGLAKFLNPADAIAPTPDGFEAVEKSVYLSGDGSTPASDHPTETTPIRAVGPEDPAIGHTSAGEVFGTAPYMPPEQARGETERVDRRSDVFALGAILCQILTGQPPYFGDPESVRNQARAGKLFGAHVMLDRCGADASQVRLAKLCLSEDPSARPADAGVLAALVTQCLEGEKDRTRQLEISRLAAEARVVEAEARERLARKARRLSRSLAVVSVMVAALLVAWIGSLSQQSVIRAADESHRHAVAVQQVKEALDEAEARHREARTAASGPLVRHAAARQALADCKRAEALLHATPEPPTELRARIDALMSQIAETQRGIELVLALTQWRNELFDAKGIIDRDAAASCCKAIFVEHEFDFLERHTVAEFSDCLTQLRALPDRTIVCDALAEWFALASGHLTSHTIAIALSEVDGRKTPINDWEADIAARDADAMIKLADDPSQPPLPVAAVSLVAGRLRERGKPAEAARLLACGLRQHPNEFTLNAQLASALRAEGQSANAIRYLNAAHAARPDDPAVERELGLALADANRTDEALDVLRSVARAEPKDAVVHTRIGELQLAQRNTDDARASFTTAVEIEPASGSAQLGLARAELVRGDLDAATMAFEAAAKSPAHTAAAHAGLGKIYLQQSEASKAVAEYRAAVEAEPTSLDHRLGLIESLRIANDPAGGLLEARAAARVFPKSAAAHRALGDGLTRTGDPAGAAAAYRRALAIEPGDRPTRRHFAQCLADRGDEVAIDELQAVVDADPESDDARAELGHVLCQLGHFRQAAATLREAAERFPADSPRREAARAAARSATRMAGLEDRLPEITADGTTLSTPAARAEVGEVCRRTKRYATAARFFAEAAARDPRYTGSAATCAALAGFARGTDADGTSPNTRAEWRKEALALFEKWPEGAKDPALAGLRRATDGLPMKERAEWKALWEGK